MATAVVGWSVLSAVEFRAYPKLKMDMSSNYKKRKSAQQARQIIRNRAENQKRLDTLKLAMGCHACGRCDVDPNKLHGHHYHGGDHKYKPLTKLRGRNWPRIMCEILGLERDKPNRGGPIVFYCERYHNELHAKGKACPCNNAEADTLRDGMEDAK